MAWSQIHATEAFLGAVETDDTVPGGKKTANLKMSGFPFQGTQTSFANNRMITGSAAAGTALACAKKTNINIISMNPRATAAYNTLAEKAKEKGMKVGIVSSVSIDHATPAVFYAHTPARNNYQQIGQQLLESGFDYFGGGGFCVHKYSHKPDSEYAGLSISERYALIETRAAKKGFQFSDTRAEFDSLSATPAIAINPYLDESHAIPYELNRINNSSVYPGSISLAEFTQKGIELLDNPDGFFMMVESGKIDWACHANDARAAIEDVIALDKAIEVALKFAAKHTNDTLIVVTGDHECGGMTLGFAGTGYETYYEKLQNQKIAFDDFYKFVLKEYKSSYTNFSEDIDRNLWQIIFTHFRMDGMALSADEQDDLTDFEKSMLENAFDKSFHGKSDKDKQADNLLYGEYDPLTVTLTHLINRKSGLTWTSFSHTAVPVPVFARGKDAWRFTGYYDNTDVAKRIAKAMRVELNN